MVVEPLRHLIRYYRFSIYYASSPRLDGINYVLHTHTHKPHSTHTQKDEKLMPEKSQQCDLINANQCGYFPHTTQFFHKPYCICLFFRPIYYLAICASHLIHVKWMMYSYFSGNFQEQTWIFFFYFVMQMPVESKCSHPNTYIHNALQISTEERKKARMKNEPFFLALWEKFPAER